MDADQDLLRDLVHQFSDPYAFYRELIQNSIDAGSSRIEVRLHYHPGPGGGTAVACVQDWGEGMTRKVIEDYLLTKFRSSKEDDLTKIGKFGIGFLSVFAPGPDAVTVQTGKDGESWRLLFHPDLRYELLRSDEPCEGTTVTLHKKMTGPQYRDLVARSEEAVRRWCRHSEADVAFTAGGADGSPPGPPRSVREPLRVDAPFQVEYREEGTFIVAGPARTSPARCGLYNRGLTLLELEEDLVPGVTFKILSRYLEHTLTRDNVRRDRHFDRALSLVKRLADRPMLDRLRAELKGAATDPARRSDHAAMLRFAHRRLPLGEVWLRTVTGKVVTGAELEAGCERVGALVVAREATPLEEAVEADGIPVLPGHEGDEVVQAAQNLLGGVRYQVRSAGSLFAAGFPDERPEAAALARAVARLLGLAGAKVDEVHVGAVRGAGAGERALRLHGAGRPTRLGEASQPVFGASGPPVLYLNTSDLAVASAVVLAGRSPHLAGLLMARLVCVSEGVLAERMDQRLTEAALEAADA